RYATQPARRRQRIVVDIGDKVMVRLGDATITRPVQAGPVLSHMAEPAASDDLCDRSIARAVVDHHHLVVRVVELAQALETAVERQEPIARADNHADRGRLLGWHSTQAALDAPLPDKPAKRPRQLGAQFLGAKRA